MWHLYELNKWNGRVVREITNGTFEHCGQTPMPEGVEMVAMTQAVYGEGKKAYMAEMQLWHAVHGRLM